ncbi:MAG: hypothetical protein Q9159_006846 [Coniocarpon cinnabarinum]
MSQTNLSEAALVVVDLQEDFCPPHGSLAIPGGRDLAKPINHLLQLSWALRVATQDWHPRDHVSFASVHGPDFQPMQSFNLHNPENSQEAFPITLWPDHCIQRTRGAELIPELDQARLDKVIKKGQDAQLEMFSAFRDVFEKPCVSQTDLASTLHDRGIKSVFVAGLARDFCVRATAVHAAAEGFSTTILADATNGFDGDETASRQFAEELQKHGVRFMTASDAGLK